MTFLLIVTAVFSSNHMASMVPMILASKTVCSSGEPRNILSDFKGLMLFLLYNIVVAPILLLYPEPSEYILYSEMSDASLAMDFSLESLMFVSIWAVKMGRWGNSFIVSIVRFSVWKSFRRL